MVAGAEEEVFSLIFSVEERIDGGQELLYVWLDGFEDVVVFGFLLFLFDGDEHPGFTFEKPAQSANGDGMGFEVGFDAIEQVAEIGFADGAKGDAKEVDFVVTHHEE